MELYGVAMAKINIKQISGAIQETTAVLRVFADGTLGDDNNDGMLYSSGTGGSFAVAAGVVTATLTGGAFTAADIGRLVTIDQATSRLNNISALITNVLAPDQITYANADGVTEAFAGYWFVSRPKKTRQAVFDIVPHLIRHNTCIHLSGTFSEVDFHITCTKCLEKVNTRLIVDGGGAITVVADNGGVPWAADISSVSTIGLTTAGWVVDAHRGYFVEVMSGPGAGQVRGIQTNTATTITVTRNFSIAPGAGAQFRIIRPKTTFSAGNTLFINVGNGLWYVQRLSITGATSSLSSSNSSTVQFSAIVHSGTSWAAYIISTCTNTSFTYNTQSPYLWIDHTLYKASCSQIGNSLYGVFANQTQALYCDPIVANKLYAKEVNGAGFYDRCNILSMTLYSCNADDEDLGSMDNACIVGGVGGGLRLVNSTLAIKEVTISNCTSHGIICDHSKLRLLGAIGGSGNGGAGVYAHSGSVVLMTHGNLPTLTGAVGNISNDGVTESVQWVTLESGVSFSDGSDLLLAKEIV